MFYKQNIRVVKSKKLTIFSFLTCFDPGNANILYKTLQNDRDCHESAKIIPPKMDSQGIKPNVFWATLLQPRDQKEEVTKIVCKKDNNESCFGPGLIFSRIFFSELIAFWNCYQKVLIVLFWGFKWKMYYSSAFEFLISQLHK